MVRLNMILKLSNTDTNNKVKNTMILRTLFLLLVGLSTLSLQACDTLKSGEAKYPTGAERGATNGDIYAKPKSVFGEGGLSIFGGKKKAPTDGVITVNSYLWRASLDTVSFMPITSVDPFGGVILTDWYTSSESASSRYKLKVFVLGSQLRSDAIKVSVFKEKARGNRWVADRLDEEMARRIEDTILTRAREMRVAKIKAESE